MSAASATRFLDRVKHFLRFDELSPLVRKILVGIIGGLVIIAGVAMIFFPGPALVVIPLGFAILASEFAWAKHYWEKFSTWLKKMRSRARAGWSRVRRKAKKVNAPG